MSRSRGILGLCCAVSSLVGVVPVSAASGGGDGGFPAENVAMLSHLPLSAFGASFAEDCWGYVSPSGREYAIIGLSTGTGFVEITDPANPVIVDVVRTSNRGRDMKVFQHYVYSSSDGGPLHIIDVGDIDNGNVTLLRSIPDGATHNVVINQESGFLYLAIAGPLAVWDLADPENPVPAGLWPGQAHDAEVVTYTEGQYAGREIAFVFSGWDVTVDVVDVTDKSNIFLVGRTDYPSPGYSHQGWLSDDRHYLYMDDEVDGIQRTLIFDVSDLANPQFVRDFTTGVPSTDHNLYLRDGFIFEANYTAGLRVFNACDPLNPVEVGFFDTFPPSDEKGFDGAWSNYPFFPSRNVIVSDRSGGLFVLDVSEAVGAGCTGDCPEDLDGSGSVDFADILAVLSAWGPCQGCPEDLDGSGSVDFADILAILAAWGPCGG